MWEFNEIFTDNSDKARLITALLSVVIAVIVVFLTHLLSYRRSKLELRAKKLEEVFAAVSEFGDLGYKLMNEKANPNGLQSESDPEYYGAHNKVEVLVSIYATFVLKEISEMHTTVLLARRNIQGDVTEFQEQIKKFIKLRVDVQEKIAKKARQIV